MTRASRAGGCGTAATLATAQLAWLTCRQPCAAGAAAWLPPLATCRCRPLAAGCGQAAPPARGGLCPCVISRGPVGSGLLRGPQGGSVKVLPCRRRYFLLRTIIGRAKGGSDVN